MPRISRTRIFYGMLKAAVRVLRDPRSSAELVADAKHKARMHQRDLKDAFEDLKTLLRLVQAWVRREYREVPWKSVMWAAAALLYFVSPLDAIPDVLAGVGFLDDVAIITMVVRAIHGDLVRFRAWERGPKVIEGDVL